MKALARHPLVWPVLTALLLIAAALTLLTSRRGRFVAH